MRFYPAVVVRAANQSAEDADLIAAVLDDFALIALEEVEDGASLRAFFASAVERDAAARGLAQAFPSLEIQSLDVPDENWAERSQAALKAVRVGALTIAPPWDAPGGATPSTIVILPSMGFGTGHHATTRLCLAALQRAEPAGKSVIDVGTGSGVLAIAAATLGAARAVGIDNDRDAIGNAVENRALNAPANVDFRCAGLEDTSDEGPFDVVLANLTGGVLVALSAHLKRLLRIGGELIVSGLREKDEQAVIRAYGLAVGHREDEEGWVCLVFRAGGP